MYRFIKFPGFKNKVLTFSYDDGARQDKRLVKILQKNGLKGTFNLCSGMFSKEYTGEEKGAMTQQEALELYPAAGMEVAVHGHRHLSLTEVPSAMALDDILTDRKLHEAVFGGVIQGMAYANGAYNDEVVDLLKKSGINYARAASSTGTFALPTDWLRWQPTCHHKDERLMELAKAFVETPQHWYYWCRDLKLFYVWGHSYEFDNDNNWDCIEEFAAYMAGREDIWYATNGEIYEYLQAASRLEFSVDGRYVKNPTCIDIYVDMLDEKRIIPAGKTVKILD